jgi:hypothetical protein
MSAQLRDYLVPYEVRESIRSEIPGTADVLSKQLATFRSLLSKRFKVADVASDKAYSLFGELAERLDQDARAGPGDDSFGPLQQLADRLLLHKSMSSYGTATNYGAGAGFGAGAMGYGAGGGMGLGRDMMGVGGMGMGGGMSALGTMRSGMADDYMSDDERWPVGMYSPTTATRSRSEPPRQPSVTSLPQPDKKPLQFQPPAVAEYVGGPHTGSIMRAGFGANDNNNSPDNVPPVEARQVVRRRVGMAAESASELLVSDDVTMEEWEPLLLKAPLNGTGKQKVILEVRGIPISQQALKVCFEAIAKLTLSKQLKAPVHLSIVDCRLNDDCCCILLKPPRNLSFISLDKCTFNLPVFEMRFKVKQLIKA